VKVRVVLFGRAADQAGPRELELEVPAGATLHGVVETLAERYPAVAWLGRASRPARNQEYAAWDEAVADGDEVSFIPPVSGG
jgi:molybdopterin converting factor subunit 1